METRATENRKQFKPGISYNMLYLKQFLSSRSQNERNKFDIYSVFKESKQK